MAADPITVATHASGKADLRGEVKEATTDRVETAMSYDEVRKEVQKMTKYPVGCICQLPATRIVRRYRYVRRAGFSVLEPASSDYTGSDVVYVDTGRDFKRQTAGREPLIGIEPNPGPRTVIKMTRAKPKKPRSRASFAQRAGKAVGKVARFVVRNDFPKVLARVPVVGKVAENVYNGAKSILSFLGVSASTMVTVGLEGDNHIVARPGHDIKENYAYTTSLQGGHVLMKYHISVGPKGSRSREMSKLYERYSITGMRLIVTPSASLTSVGVLAYFVVPDVESKEIEAMSPDQVLATAPSRPCYQQINIRDRGSVKIQLPQQQYYIRNVANSSERLVSPGILYVVAVTGIDSAHVPVIEQSTDYRFYGASTDPLSYGSMSWFGRMYEINTMEPPDPVLSLHFAGTNDLTADALTKFTRRLRGVEVSGYLMQASAGGQYNLPVKKRGWSLAMSPGEVFTLISGGTVGDNFGVEGYYTSLGMFTTDSTSDSLIKSSLAPVERELSWTAYQATGEAPATNLATAFKTYQFAATVPTRIIVLAYHDTMQTPLDHDFVPFNAASECLAYAQLRDESSSTIAGELMIRSVERETVSFCARSPINGLSSETRDMLKVALSRGRYQALPERKSRTVALPSPPLRAATIEDEYVDVSRRASTTPRVGQNAQAMKKKIAGVDLVGIEPNPGPPGKERDKARVAAALKKKTKERAATQKAQAFQNAKKPVKKQSPNVGKMPNDDEVYWEEEAIDSLFDYHEGPVTYRPVVPSAPSAPSAPAATVVAGTQHRSHIGAMLPISSLAAKNLEDAKRPPPENPAYKKPGGRGACRDWLAGKCNRTNCKFAHVKDKAPPREDKVCRDFAAGKCVRSNCKYLHPVADVPLKKLPADVTIVGSEEDRRVVREVREPRGEVVKLLNAVESVGVRLRVDASGVLPTVVSLPEMEVGRNVVCAYIACPACGKEAKMEKGSVARCSHCPGKPCFMLEQPFCYQCPDCDKKTPSLEGMYRDGVRVAVKPDLGPKYSQYVPARTLPDGTVIPEVLSRETEFHAWTVYPCPHCKRYHNISTCGGFVEVPNHFLNAGGLVGSVASKNFCNAVPVRSVGQRIKSFFGKIKRNVKQWITSSPFPEPAPIHTWSWSEVEKAGAVTDLAHLAPGTVDYRQTSNLASPLRRPYESEFITCTVKSAYDAYTQCGVGQVRVHRLLVSELIAHFGLKKPTDEAFNQAYDTRIRNINVKALEEPGLREATRAFMEDLIDSVKNSRLLAGLNFH